MIFFELKKYGDFDMSYTDSMWYKENPTEEELTFHKHGTLLNEMLIEFKNLSGEQFRTEDAFIHSIYCGSKEAQVLQAFKDYLKARGYQGVKTTKLQFTDEKWCEMEKSK